MNDFDDLQLDARLLRTLLAVHEAGSVTGAALRLGVTQSAVSHLLDRLRAITGDPLFVRRGRGIVATARAEALAPQARELLRALHAFTQADTFDPARLRTRFTIAANDLQRDLLLPALAQRLRTQAPQASLRVIPSDVPRLDMLRADQCHLVISPRPPEGSDILQKRLFEDRYRVFYDAASRLAPRSRAAYLSAPHATVVYEPRRSLDIDARLAEQGLGRRVVLEVTSFAALAAFIPGTDCLVTAPSGLAAHALRGLAHSAPPLPCPPLPVYMIWHARYQQDPAHMWLRAQLEAAVPAALRAGPTPLP